MSSQIERPVLLGRVGSPSTVSPPQARASNRVVVRDQASRQQRLDQRMDAAMEAFGAQIELTTSIQATDPQLVLVLDAVEDRTDLVDVARRLGLEVLVEAESAIDPDDEYALMSENARDPMIRTCLHAVCADSASLERLRSAWTGWKRTREVPGNSKLRDLFNNLKDIRPWGPEDRLKLVNWDDHFAGRVDTDPHPIEIELWYRQSQQFETLREAK